MTFTRLALFDFTVDAVIGHARAESPNECCGLLAGEVDGSDGLVLERFPISNDRASPTDYYTNPRDMLAAFRRIRKRGWELLAVYHSHPTSEPIPSQRDLEQNTYGESVVHLIVGFGESDVSIRGWWLGEATYRPAEVLFGYPEA